MAKRTPSAFRIRTASRQGDFGLSHTSRLLVAPTARRAFFTSLQMIGPAVAIAATLGVLLGMVAATRPGRVAKAIGAFSALAASIPAHVFGPLTVLVFGIWLSLLPTDGGAR